MNKIMLKVVLFTLAPLLGSQVTAQVLLEGDTTWDGGSFYYPEGEPHVTTQISVVEPGNEAGFHCHPVATFGYVLEGSIEIETIDGIKVLLNAGDPFFEVMHTVHKGQAVGGTARVLVIHAGTENLPNTVFADDDLAAEYCT